MHVSRLDRPGWLGKCYFPSLLIALMSRIERRYCFLNTSYNDWVINFVIFILLHIDKIGCVLVNFYQWWHFVMPIMRSVHLICGQSWTYLAYWKHRGRILKVTSLPLPDSNASLKGMLIFTLLLNPESLTVPFTCTYWTCCTVVSWIKYPQVHVVCCVN